MTNPVRHRNPTMTISYKFMQKTAISSWIKQSQDPRWASLNMHNVIFFSADVLEPFPVCPDNPEHKAQKAITHSGEALYPYIAITRESAQNVW